MTEEVNQGQTTTLMAQKVQKMTAGHQEQPDHLIMEINKLLYPIEDNGSQNTKYNKRGQLKTWLTGSYTELTQAIIQTLQSINITIDQSHIFTQPDLSAVAFDTRSGTLYKLTPPYYGLGSDRLDQSLALLSALTKTTDQRSL